MFRRREEDRRLGGGTLLVDQFNGQPPLLAASSTSFTSRIVSRSPVASASLTMSTTSAVVNAYAMLKELRYAAAACLSKMFFASCTVGPPWKLRASSRVVPAGKPVFVNPASARVVVVGTG